MRSVKPGVAAVQWSGCAATPTRTVLELLQPEGGGEPEPSELPA